MLKLGGLVGFKLAMPKPILDQACACRDSTEPSTVLLERGAVGGDPTGGSAVSTTLWTDCLSFFMCILHNAKGNGNTPQELLEAYKTSRS